MNSIAPDAHLAVHLAGSAFDTIAESYDSLFTMSMIGRSQRAAVWRKAETVFRAGDHVLELNCGTGTDALFLASRGIAITACDASPRMVEQAQKQIDVDAPRAAVDFRVLCTERLDELPSDLLFDGAFSNFSGLNCISDLSKIWRLLARRLHPGAQVLICLSTRFCMWEILHYLSMGEIHKAGRRCRGTAEATIGRNSFPVYYPTLRSLRQSLGPMFHLRSVTGIGITVPPSYMESWARRYPSALRFCDAVDRFICEWPGIRVLGDHMLLRLERVEQWGH
jgi:ubiquinone/menaquinone biosynthesis C-methylase UbiE